MNSNIYRPNWTRRNLYEIAALGLVIQLTSSCATSTRSTGLGAGLGGGTGAIVGSVMSSGKSGEVRTRNVILGTTLGALAGGLTGSLVYQGSEKSKQEAYLKGKQDGAKEAPKGTPPQVKEPKVESIWVEGRAVGNRYIEGHYEYVITEPTRWEEN